MRRMASKSFGWNTELLYAINAGPYNHAKVQLKLDSQLDVLYQSFKHLNKDRIHRAYA